MRPVQNVSTTENLARTQILAVGPLGSGKTTAFRTLPGKKFIYIFDPNGRVALGNDDIDFLEFIPSVDELDMSVKPLSAKKPADKVTTKKRSEPRTYVDWYEDFVERCESGFFGAYDWVGLDSLTTLSECIMDRVQFLNGRLGKQPEQADYAAEMTSMRGAIRALSSLTNFYCTGHVETVKNDITGRISNELLITGKNKARLPVRFAHIFGFTADRSEKGEVVFQVRTIHDRSNPYCRTPFQLKAIEDVTLDFNRPLEGQGIGAWFKR